MNSPLRICLYVAVPPEREYAPHPISAWGSIKQAVGRNVDIAKWLLLGRARLNFHHWNTHDVTNKGDVAIRESIKEQLAAAVAPREVIFTEIGWGDLDVAQAAEIGGRHDLFVIAGSGYIFSHEGGDINPRAKADRAFIEALPCRKIAYGIGWNKLLKTSDFGENRPLTAGARETLKGTLAPLDLISVRDRATQELVTDITGREPVLTGDPALFYRGTGSAVKFSDGKLHVGVNFAFHGKESVDRIARQHAIFRDALVEFARRHDVVYHYMQHTHTERSMPLLLRGKGIVVKQEDRPPCELPAFYGALDLHLCQMLHSAILAMNAGVPTVNFAYDVKSKGFFDLMELPQLCFPDWPLSREQVLAELESLLENSARIRAHIESRKSEIQKAVGGFLGEIRTLVAERVG